MEYAISLNAKTPVISVALSEIDLNKVAVSLYLLKKD
jgi:hypothetical protein